MTPRRYPGLLQARTTLHQAGCVAQLAEAAGATEAEVLRHALTVLFSSGDDEAILWRFELARSLEAQDEVDQAREDRN